MPVPTSRKLRHKEGTCPVAQSLFLSGLSGGEGMKTRHGKREKTNGDLSAQGMRDTKGTTRGTPPLEAES